MSRPLWQFCLSSASLLLAFGAAAQDVPPAASPTPGTMSVRAPAAADSYLPRDDDVSYTPRRGCGPTLDGERATADGKTHGEVAAAVGSDGYRAAGARICAPLSSGGEIQLQVSRTQGGYPAGSGGRRH